MDDIPFKVQYDKDFERQIPKDITEDQVAEIKAGQEKLMQSAQKLFAKVYEQSQAAQGAGPDMGAAGAGPDMGGSADDDVVDADYKEV